MGFIILFLFYFSTCRCASILSPQTKPNQPYTSIQVINESLFISCLAVSFLMLFVVSKLNVWPCEDFSHTSTTSRSFYWVYNCPQASVRSCCYMDLLNTHFWVANERHFEIYCFCTLCLRGQAVNVALKTHLENPVKGSNFISRSEQIKSDIWKNTLVIKILAWPYFI